MNSRIFTVCICSFQLLLCTNLVYCDIQSVAEMLLLKSDSSSSQQQTSDLLNSLKALDSTSLSPEMKKTLAHYLIQQALGEQKSTSPASATVPTQATQPGLGSPSLPQSHGPFPIAEGSRNTAPTIVPVLPASGPETVLTPAGSSTNANDSQSTEFVLGQVNKILQNVGSLNIVGIVDESIGIVEPTNGPVRNLVGGLLQSLFCNPITGLFNRCTPNRVASSATSPGNTNSRTQ